MREILFRGKTDKGEWVYGVPTKDDFDATYIVQGLFECDEYKCTGADSFDVDENTIGQYTGLTDKNGTKIFEGDIVVMNIKGYNTICKVAWADNVAQFQLWQTNTIPHTPTALNLGNYDCEIIGNIHDNPELLKELGK